MYRNRCFDIIKHLYRMAHKECNNFEHEFQGRLLKIDTLGQGIIWDRRAMSFSEYATKKVLHQGHQVGAK